MGSFGAIATMSTLLGACGLLLDTGGLSGSGDAPVDAGEAGTESTADAATSSDGGSNTPVADAGSDAPTTPKPAYCKNLAPAPTFCDDFDDRPLGFDWPTPVTTAGATRAYDTKDPVSPPNVLRWDVPASATTLDDTSGSQEKVFPVVQSIACGYAVQIASTNPATGASTGSVRVPISGGSITLDISQPSTLDKASLLETVSVSGQPDQYVEHPMTRWPRLGVWTRVEWKVYLDGTNAHARVSIDGIEAVDAVLSKYVLRDYASCGIGVMWVSPAKGGWTARFDDVAMTVVPN